MIVTLEGVSAGTTLGIVDELEAQGVMRGTDFTFKYHHTEHQYGRIRLRYSEFTFPDDTLGIWFQLKYG